MPDPTEAARRTLQQEINADPTSRPALEAQHGDVWDTSELQETFTVVGFAAPFVVVVRKADGVQGSLQFQHRPRLYWGFHPLCIGAFTPTADI